ncbi:MAG: TIGR03619 family F420-dependent LLM class oxidoreductase [Myxococcales bacterium]|nr:TIGR03619 family F420-dependent LLM class oxidoreductase [Myxococcales bacterium]
MKFWQSITWAETDQLCDIARLAEELGFEGVIGADHAFYPETLVPAYPYSDTGFPPQTADSEYPDMWVSCAAMAAVTTALKFVCGIYVLPIRNPLEVAKQAATLSILSQGRFILGVGTGWMKEEFDVYGVDFATRGPRTDEMIEVMRRAWRGEMFDYHGAHFDIPRIRVNPAPASAVPIYFGGAAPVALRRAAREGDGFISAGNTPEEVPPLMAELARMRGEFGREDRPFETIVGLYAPPELDLLREMEDAGMTSGVHLPFHFAFEGPSTFDRKRGLMEEFAEKTLRHFR